MKQGIRTIVTLSVASVFALTVGMSSAWANEPATMARKVTEAADMGRWADMARA